MARKPRNPLALPHAKGKARRKYVLKATRPIQDVNKILAKAEKAAKVTYDEEMAAKICTLVAHGMSLPTICEIDGFPTLRAVRYWMAERPEFKALHDAAADARLEYYVAGIFERLEEVRHSAQIIDKTTGRTMIDPAAVALAKVYAENVRWLLSKSAPLKYGDLHQHRLQGHDGGPLALPRPAVLEQLPHELLVTLEVGIERALEASAADAAEDGEEGESGTEPS